MLDEGEETRGLQKLQEGGGRTGVILWKTVLGRGFGEVGVKDMKRFVRP